MHQVPKQTVHNELVPAGQSQIKNRLQIEKVLRYIRHVITTRDQRHQSTSRYSEYSRVVFFDKRRVFCVFHQKSTVRSQICVRRQHFVIIKVFGTSSKFLARDSTF